MTTREYERFSKILEAMQAELTRALRRRDGITIERVPDMLDEIQLATARELKTRSLERETGLLRDVRTALSRIADGTYSTCLECDEEISHKRMQAIPWATLCIRCQERADRSVSPNLYLKDAA